MQKSQTSYSKYMLYTEASAATQHKLTALVRGTTRVWASHHFNDLARSTDRLIGSPSLRTNLWCAGNVL